MSHIWTKVYFLFLQAAIDHHSLSSLSHLFIVNPIGAISLLDRFSWRVIYINIMRYAVQELFYELTVRSDLKSSSHLVRNQWTDGIHRACYSCTTPSQFKRLEANSIDFPPKWISGLSSFDGKQSCRLGSQCHDAKCPKCQLLPSRKRQVFVFPSVFLGKINGEENGTKPMKSTVFQNSCPFFFSTFLT